MANPSADWVCDIVCVRLVVWDALPEGLLVELTVWEGEPDIDWGVGTCDCVAEPVLLGEVVEDGDWA